MHPTLSHVERAWGLLSAVGIALYFGVGWLIHTDEMVRTTFPRHVVSEAERLDKSDKQLAVLTGMMTKTFSRIVANLAWKNVKFVDAIRAGETIYAESTVLEKRESKSRPGQGIILVRTVGRTHDGRVICTFERSILVYGRGQGPYEAAGY